MIHVPKISTAQILAGTLTVTFDLTEWSGDNTPGTVYPENIVVYSTISAMSGSETLDFYGKAPGMDDYAATVLTTQIDVKAAESTVVRTMLKAADVGPLSDLKLIATNIAAAETIDFVILSW